MILGIVGAVVVIGLAVFMSYMDMGGKKKGSEPDETDRNPKK